MELLIAFVLGTLLGILVMQLLGLTEWFAKFLVANAVAHLPRPLRNRVQEECYSEIEELRGAFPKLYVAFTCFLDAVGLHRLWRGDQLRRLALKREKAHTRRSAIRKRRAPDTRSWMPGTKEWRKLQALGTNQIGGARPPRPSLRSVIAAALSDIAFLLAPGGYRPQNRANAKVMSTLCGRKIWRLDRGVWVDDWLLGKI